MPKINQIVFFLVLLVLISPAQAEKLNLGMVDHKSINEKYLGFTDSFDKAFVGFPKGFLGLQAPFHGTYDEALVKLPGLKDSSEKLPTVVYMQGSGKFSKGPTFRE